MAPLLPSNSLALTVCDNHFCIEYSQNSFSHYPTVGSFWSAKYLILGKSRRLGQPIILFQKADTLKILKIHIMFCFPSGVENHNFQFQAHGLNTLILENFTIAHFRRIYLHDFHPFILPNGAGKNQRVSICIYKLRCTEYSSLS